VVSVSKQNAFHSFHHTQLCYSATSSVRLSVCHKPVQLEADRRITMAYAQGLDFHTLDLRELPCDGFKRDWGGVGENGEKTLIFD